MSDAGRHLANRYVLLSELGRGGMGTVYRARDEVLGREVAIKLLPAAVADRDPVNVTRFEREARAAATLNHPGVIAVYDAGQDGDERYIVMELAEGESLDALIRRQGTLAPMRAARIAAGVADALAAAHAAGIVHRDIKPGNVMIAPDGRVKVLDFGIARLAEASTLTLTDSVIGTAAYMSPEQVLGQPATARSDLYALGCVLFAMLTGRPPFRGENAAAILHAQASQEAPPPSAQRPGIPPALDALTLGLLAKDPRARPQDADRVRDRLTASTGGSVAAVANADDRTAITAVGPAGAPPATLVQSSPTMRQPGPPTPPTAATRVIDRRRRRGPLAALAALLAVIALIAILTSGGTTPRPAASTHSTTTGSSARTTPVSSSASTPAATPVSSSSSSSSTTPAPTTTAGATPAAPAGPQGPAAAPGHATPPGQAKKDHGPKPGKGPGKPG